MEHFRKQEVAVHGDAKARCVKTELINVTTQRAVRDPGAQNSKPRGQL